MLNLDDLEQRAHAVPLGGNVTLEPGELLDLVLRVRVAETALRGVARSVVAAIEQTGQIVTVERVARLPLAMGNHEPRVSFRPALGRA